MWVNAVTIKTCLNTHINMKAVATVRVCVVDTTSGAGGMRACLQMA